MVRLAYSVCTVRGGGGGGGVVVFSRVKSGELAAEFTPSLPFTHAPHSGRFSSHQHQILCIIQARGGAAGCSRQRQEAEITWSWLQHRDTASALITTNSPDIFLSVFYVCVIAFLRLGDICFLLGFFCVHFRQLCSNMHLLQREHRGSAFKACLKQSMSGLLGCLEDPGGAPSADQAWIQMVGMDGYFGFTLFKVGLTCSSVVFLCGVCMLSMWKTFTSLYQPCRHFGPVVPRQPVQLRLAPAPPPPPRHPHSVTDNGWMDGTIRLTPCDLCLSLYFWSQQEALFKKAPNHRRT